MGSSAGIELDRYSNGNAVLPGIYDVGVSVNNKTVGNARLTFIDLGDNKSAKAVLVRPPCCCAISASPVPWK